MTVFTKSVVKEVALAWLESLGYAVLHDPDIAAGEPASERQDYSRLRDMLLLKLISGELRVKASI